jgi:hypothetical protein
LGVLAERIADDTLPFHFLQVLRLERDKRLAILQFLTILDEEPGKDLRQIGFLRLNLKEWITKATTEASPMEQMATLTHDAAAAYMTGKERTEAVKAITIGTRREILQGGMEIMSAVTTALDGAVLINHMESIPCKKVAIITVPTAVHIFLALIATAMAVTVAFIEAIVQSEGFGIVAYLLPAATITLMVTTTPTRIHTIATAAVMVAMPQLLRKRRRGGPFEQAGSGSPAPSAVVERSLSTE